MSAAHSAAPVEHVKRKNRDRMGTSSRSMATVPNHMYSHDLLLISLLRSFFVKPLRSYHLYCENVPSRLPVMTMKAGVPT